MRAEARDALVAFAERKLPALLSWWRPWRRACFPRTTRSFAGVLDMACNQVVWDFLASCDLIVTAGFDAVELIKPWSLKLPVLHVDSLPNTDQIYQAGTECVGNIGAIFEWFTAEWSGEPRWSEASIAEHRATLREAYYAGRVAGRLNPTDVVDAVRALPIEHGRTGKCPAPTSCWWGRAGPHTSLGASS